MKTTVGVYRTLRPLSTYLLRIVYERWIANSIYFNIGFWSQKTIFPNMKTRLSKKVFHGKI